MPDPRAPVLQPVAQRAVVDAFLRAIYREAHNLTDSPHLLWQQFYNRLQWEEGLVQQVLQAELYRRITPSAGPWMRRRSRFRESATLIRTLAGHTGPITACAITLDGSVIVSASNDHTLRVWDVATGQARATLVGHGHEVRACAISPDGTLIVSASRDGTLRLWNAQTGVERATLAGHGETINTCAVSPDWAFVVSASDDGTMKVWDLQTGSERATLAGHSSAVIACAISPDASFVASTSIWDSLKVWNIPTGTERDTVSGYVKRSWDYIKRHPPAGACSVSPDGSFILWANDCEATLHIWTSVSGIERAALTGHQGARRADAHGVSDCAIGPDATFIVSAGRDGTLKISDPRSGAERTVLVGHARLDDDHMISPGDIRDCAISPDGSFIVSASRDGTLKVWDPETGAERATLVGHSGAVNACLVSLDGSSIVSAGSDGVLKIWRASPGLSLPDLPGHAGPVTACAISPDGSFIVSASRDGTLKLWDPETGAERASLAERTGAVNACAVSADGSFVVAAFEYGNVKVLDPRLQTIRSWVHYGEVDDLDEGTQWAPKSVEQCLISPDRRFIVFADATHLKIAFLDTGAEQAISPAHAWNITTCAISPDGSFIVSGSIDGTLKVWDPQTGRERIVMAGHSDSISSCAISPDARFIVSASSDHTLKIWDAATGQARATLAGHTHRVNACAISLDGTVIVSAAFDKTLRIWDAVSGQVRAILIGHSRPVSACAITPDGALVVSASCGDSLKLWDADRGHEVAACRLPGIRPSCIAVHPFIPKLAVGSGSGDFLLVDLVNINYGPLVVTAVDRGTEMMVRCPACRHDVLQQQDALGQMIACPNPTCAHPLRVNPFVTRMGRG